MSGGKAESRSSRAKTRRPRRNATADSFFLPDEMVDRVAGRELLARSCSASPRHDEVRRPARAIAVRASRGGTSLAARGTRAGRLVRSVVLHLQRGGRSRLAVLGSGLDVRIMR